MNIFVTSRNPIKAARYLDDKRVVKMCLESAQILSNIVGGPYKPTHLRHPVVLWVWEHERHQDWLWSHFQALCEEYTWRFGKTHECEKVMTPYLHYHYRRPEWAMEDISFEDCSGQNERGLVANYRQCLRQKWVEDKRKPKWTNRLPPFWA
jgi:hypothetical protein